VTRRELLAVVTFTHRFRHYLYGRAFVLRTDHAALRWLFQTFEPSGQTARWIAKLADYVMVIKHRPGELHANADGLSRTPLLLTDGTLNELPTDHPMRAMMPTNDPEEADFDTTSKSKRVQPRKCDDEPPVDVHSVLSKHRDPPAQLSLNGLLRQERDSIFSRVRDYVRDANWPTLKELADAPPELRTYHAIRTLLVLIGTAEDGVVFYQKPSRDWSNAGAERWSVSRTARCALVRHC
jgi:hypothetical protein